MHSPHGPVSARHAIQCHTRMSRACVPMHRCVSSLDASQPKIHSCDLPPLHVSAASACEHVRLRHLHAVRTGGGAPARSLQAGPPAAPRGPAAAGLRLAAPGSHFHHLSHATQRCSDNRRAAARRRHAPIVTTPSSDALPTGGPCWACSSSVLYHRSRMRAFCRGSRREAGRRNAGKRHGAC